MPWTAEEFRNKHWKNATDAEAKKASSIANAMLKDGADEGAAVATAIKKAKGDASAAHSNGDEIISQWGGEVKFDFAAESTAPDPSPEVPAASRAHVGAGGDEKTPIPKLSLEAYNGGPMRLGGFSYPVIIELSGVRFATEKTPIYVGHPSENISASEMMEALVGQAECGVVKGCIKGECGVTGSSKTVNLMLEHARKGFKFQNSIHGRPTELSFIRAGETATINGRAVAGPVTVAKQSVLDHIAILPLGADTSTSVHIAAGNAAGEINMEFTAWLKAEYNIDEDAYNKLPETRRQKIKAEFDSVGEEPDKDKTPEPDKKIQATGQTAVDDEIKAQNAAMSANMTRIADIKKIDGADTQPEIVAKAIGEGWTVEKAENAILKAQRDSLTQSHSRGSAAGGAGFSFSAQNAARVLEASALISCGYDGERLVKDRRYGEQVVNETDKLFRAEGRAMTPSHIAAICARANGVYNLPHGHGDDFWSDVLANQQICPRGGQRISAEFSTMSLPVALSNIMNKFLLDSYMSVDPDECDPTGGVAWKKFARVTSVQDFKPHYRIRMVASLLLKKLLKGGEIQHGTVGEQSYMLTADTKAIMLGLTRKDLINDDQSVLSSLPTHFGLGAAETVANDVYACLLAGYQSDGSTAFFTASDVTTEGNKMKANQLTGSALSFTTLEAARKQFALQTKPNGQPAGLLGRILLVPPGLAGLARQLCESDMLIASLSTGGNARGVPANNTLKGLQKPVCSSYLANGAINTDTDAKVSGSPTTWYLTTTPTSPAYMLEVGFLNGMEVPIIERAEADFQRLGIGFRTFLDYGVAMGEPRSAIQCTA